LFAFKARATSLGRPAPAVTAGCFGVAVFAGVDVVPVLVVVLVPVAVVLVAGVFAGTATLPVSSPALVTRNVMAKTRTPNAATIAGRGRSIRVAVGTVWVERSFANCVFGT
jgi:hypothetical protein